MFYRFLTILRNTLLNVIFLYFFIWKNYVETSILTIMVLSIQLLFNKVSNPSVKYWPTFTQIPELPKYRTPVYNSKHYSPEWVYSIGLLCMTVNTALQLWVIIQYRTTVYYSKLCTTGVSKYTVQDSCTHQ